MNIEKTPYMGQAPRIRSHRAAGSKWYRIQSRTDPCGVITLVTWRGDDSRNLRPFLDFDAAAILIDRNQAVKILREGRK